MHLETHSNTDGQCKVDSWSDIVQIAVYDNTTLGLKNDGTVLATGENDRGQCSVSDWVNVKAICCSGDVSFGLTEDGKLYTTLDSYFKGSTDCRLIPRKFQEQNAIRIDGYSSVNNLEKEALLLVAKTDNTIELFGENEYGFCDKPMDIINGASTTETDSGKAEEKTDAKVTNNDEKIVENIEYNYTTEEFASLITKGINGTLSVEEAALLERYYQHYK